MKDMRAVRTNEKLKRVSTLFGNGGLGLLIAGFSRWYGKGLDVSAGTWIFVACGLMLVSVQMNELLNPEDEA